MHAANSAGFTIKRLPTGGEQGRSGAGSEAILCSESLTARLRPGFLRTCQEKLLTERMLQEKQSRKSGQALLHWLVFVCEGKEHFVKMRNSNCFSRAKKWLCSEGKLILRV